MFSCWFWIFISYNVLNVLSFGSYISLSGFGKEYAPVSHDALFLANQTATSRLKCAAQCNQFFRCQIFNYDESIQQCQLFEGGITLTGSIISSSSATSIVGHIQLYESNFEAYHQSCEKCNDNRFLRCIYNQCECQEHTYWNGSLCLAQMPLVNMDCKYNTSMCRTDLGLTCGTCNNCVNNSVITFDDLQPSTAVPEDYHNINWTNTYIYTKSTNSSGYYTGVVSKNNTSYNSYGNPAIMTTANGCLFTLNSLSVAAAWNDNLQLTIIGYNSNVVIQNKTYTLQVFTLLNLTFSGYVGLDQIVFSTSGGTPNLAVSGPGTQYAMDNIDLTFI